jgi:hypothetical protein
MPRRSINSISFTKVYPLYVERRRSTKADIDEVIRWPTG